MRRVFRRGLSCALVLMLSSPSYFWRAKGAEPSELLSGSHGVPCVTPAGNSSSPVISRNGRFILFFSEALNIVTNQTEGAANLYLYDLTNKTTTLVTVSSNGVSGGNGPPGVAMISGDGRFVAFESHA